MENFQQTESVNNSETSISEIIAPYLRVWPLIIISALIGLACGYLYLRYTDKLYRASTSVIIKDTRGSGGLSELSPFQSIGVLGGSGGNSLDNEIEILTSKRLMYAVVRELNLDVAVLREGSIKVTEAYNNHPYDITFIDNPNTNPEKRSSKTFYVKGIDSESFGLKFNKEKNYQSYNYGQLIDLGRGSVVIEPKSSNKKKSPVAEVVVKVSNPLSAARSLQSRISVVVATARGSVLDISITDKVLDRAEDILNELIVQYNADAINDKNIVARNTAAFIEDRIRAVGVDLDSVENKIQNFKTSNNLSDIEAQAQMNLGSSNEFKAKIINAEEQFQLAKFLESELRSQEIGQLFPNNVGIENLEINSGINRYNDIALRYQELESTATDINPRVIQLRDQLTTLRSAIFLALDNYLSALEIRRKSLNFQDNKVDYKLGQVPETEKVFRGIARNQTIIESIYLFLVTKREETAISLAVTAPKAKVVDSAWGSNSSIAPNPRTILLGSFAAGMMLPLLIVFILNFLYNKITNRKDVINKLPNIPFIGEIPKIDKDESSMIEENDRTVLAESFRMLRTNLLFKISALPASIKSPVIIVTSSIKGEGKTFVSYNLAMTMANSGKKVLLIGGDIRNPQLQRYLKDIDKTAKGVSEYLIFPEHNIEDLIHDSDSSENLKILLSGTIPPNPAELWMRDKVDQMLAYGRAHYDVVIIDTAPSMLVTDTLLISEKSDITVYVSRANYSEKPLLDFVKDTVKSGKLKNVVMLLNSVKSANFGYGNKYAYSYGVEENTSVWDRMLKTLKIKS